MLMFLLDSISTTLPYDYETLKNELSRYNPALLEKKRIICITKSDAWDSDYINSLSKVDFGEPDTPVFIISSVTGKNIENLKKAMWYIVEQERK